jgi:hypothetical protein
VWVHCLEQQASEHIDKSTCFVQDVYSDYLVVCYNESL